MSRRRCFSPSARRRITERAADAATVTAHSATNQSPYRPYGVPSSRARISPRSTSAANGAEAESTRPDGAMIADPPELDARTV